MKRRIFSLMMVFSLLFTGCASTTNRVDLIESSVDLVETPIFFGETANQESEAMESQDVESVTLPLFDKDVSVILSMYGFNESTTVEDYIDNLRKANPEEVYAVYDDSHYIHTLKESARKAMVEEFKSEEYIKSAFQEIFSDEQYGGAFVSMEYDELFQDITFYADQKAYSSAGLFAVLGPVLIGSAFSDIVQGYNLVPLEERSVTIKVIDEQTGGVLYDSSAK